MPGGCGKREARARPSRAERCRAAPRRQPHEQLRPVRRALLEEDRVGAAGARRARRTRGLRAAARRPRAGRARAEARTARAASVSRARTTRASSAQTGPGRREHREVGRAAVHLGRILAHHRDPRPRLDERAGGVRVLPEGRRADGEHDVVRRERRGAGAARSAGRWPANRRMILGEAGPALKDSCQTGQASLSASATSASHVSASSAPAPTTSAGRSALRRGARRAARQRRRPPPRARTTRRGAARSAVGSASASQSSIGTITSAGPRPVTASWYARAIAPGTSCARAGCVDPDRILAGEPERACR